MAKIKKMDLAEIISLDIKSSIFPSIVETKGIARGIMTSNNNHYEGLLQVPGKPLFLKFEGYCKSSQFKDVVSILKASETSGVPVTVHAQLGYDASQKYFDIYALKLGNLKTISMSMPDISDYCNTQH